MVISPLLSSVESQCTCELQCTCDAVPTLSGTRCSQGQCLAWCQNTVWIKQQVRSATCISMWQHSQLSKQILLWEIWRKKLELEFSMLLLLLVLLFYFYLVAWSVPSCIPSRVASPSRLVPLLSCPFWLIHLYFSIVSESPKEGVNPCWIDQSNPAVWHKEVCSSWVCWVSHCPRLTLCGCVVWCGVVLCHVCRVMSRVSCVLCHLTASSLSAQCV